MTICVALKVNDCLVFVSDSASTLTNQAGQITHVYNHGHKVFNLAHDIPVAGMTCGLGNFDRESISDVVKRVRNKLSKRRGNNKLSPQNVVIEEVAKTYFSEFRALYKKMDSVARTKTSFEFFVGGYSGSNGDAELWKIVLSGDSYACNCIQGCDQVGLSWAGQPEAIIRLVQGVSPKTRDVLKSIGLDDAQATGVYQTLAKEQKVDIYSAAMPVHDAIALAEFLAETTVKFVKFLPGANTVGGGSRYCDSYKIRRIQMDSKKTLLLTRAKQEY